MKTACQTVALVVFLGIHATWAQEIRRKGEDRKEARKKEAVVPAEGAVAPKASGLSIAGKLTDAETGEPVIGAYIKVIGTVNGTVSGTDGSFKLDLSGFDKAALEITSVGYKPETLSITESRQDWSVKLAPDNVMLDEVVVSASRVGERALESPVTIEKIDLQDARENPTLNFYDMISSLKGVDQYSSSMTFKDVNTRGFGWPGNTRMIQRVDGVDMQAPGLNFPVGMLTGASDLDLESLELIPGAASALYGPNALNGVIDIVTKNPFKYPGLSVSVRVGANHLDSRDTTPQPTMDFNLRYAGTIKNRFGYKINATYFRAYDWVAADYSDEADYLGTTNLQKWNADEGRFVPKDLTYGNPGYDGVNTYGDEISQVFTPAVFSFLGLPDLLRGDTLKISRTGYRERDVADYNTYFAKADLSLYYKISNDLMISASSKFNMGTSIYQGGNRNVLTNFKFHTHRVEVSGPRLLARAYASIEDAGGSYDSRFSGVFLNRAYKPDISWFYQYLLAYSPFTNGIVNSLINQYRKDNGLPEIPQEQQIRSLNDADARAFAESDNRYLFPYVLPLGPLFGLDSAAVRTITDGRSRLIPGTPDFRRALDSVNALPIGRGGARFLDQTQMYHAEAQYDLTGKVKFVDILAGGHLRLFNLNSRGTIFIDTTDKPLVVFEYGAFVQLTKRFVEDRLRVSTSLRLDQSLGLKPQLSPRIAAVGLLGAKRNHSVRASFQTAFRNPTLQGRFMNLDVQIFRYLGGNERIDREYNLLYYEGGRRISNCYLYTDVEKALETGDSSSLRYYDIRDVEPELVIGPEIGYKASLWNRFAFDVNLFYSIYSNFIITRRLLGPAPGENGYQGQRLTFQDLVSRNYRIYRRYTNEEGNMYVYGASVGLSYGINRHFSVSFNYTYTDISTEIDLDQAEIGFNTPKHKTNAAFIGRNLFKHFGFAVKHKWVDAYDYLYNIGMVRIPSYNVLDLQVSYRVPRIKTEFKIGGSNVLNYRHIEAFGSPMIGAMVFFQATFDQFLN
ncbi:MAG: carboxypeptidase-like regulatory domain-containing protein [Bacteroidia bacterium]|nr:carboxypeptidase-like regulatory domain-containing protein [Bacteroidia bacterium]